MSDKSTSMIVRFSDDRIIKGLDEYAEREGITRNQLVINILHLFLTAKDDFVTQCTPIIVRSLLKSEIDKIIDIVKELIKELNDSVKLSTKATLKMNLEADRLGKFLIPEFEKIQYENMQIDEMLQLYETMEKDNND